MQACRKDSWMGCVGKRKGRLEDHELLSESGRGLVNESPLLVGASPSRPSRRRHSQCLHLLLYQVSCQLLSSHPAVEVAVRLPCLGNPRRSLRSPGNRSPLSRCSQTHRSRTLPLPSSGIAAPTRRHSLPPRDWHHSRFHHSLEPGTTKFQSTIVGSPTRAKPARTRGVARDALHR